MKKLILLTALFIIGTSSLNAADANEAAVQSSETNASAPTAAPTASGGLGDSFMAAFGMDASAAGDTGEGGPGSGGSSSSSAGSMSAGMAAISTSATNQVTPPFTPYSYRK